MSLFDSILHKIVHAAETVIVPGGSARTSAPSAAETASTSTPVVPAEAAPPQSNASLQSIDVEAVLANLASQKGGGGNWRNSIVDLLKLLDLDSSLNARKQLAEELGVHAGADGSAEQNIALHKAVMLKIAENGGKVPDSLRA